MKCADISLIDNVFVEGNITSKNKQIENVINQSYLIDEDTTQTDRQEVYEELYFKSSKQSSVGTREAQSAGHQILKSIFPLNDFCSEQVEKVSLDFFLGRQKESLQFLTDINTKKGCLDYQVGKGNKLINTLQKISGSSLMTAFLISIIKCDESNENMAINATKSFVEKQNKLVNYNLQKKIENLHEQQKEAAESQHNAVKSGFLKVFSIILDVAQIVEGAVELAASSVCGLTVTSGVANVLGGFFQLTADVIDTFDKNPSDTKVFSDIAMALSVVGGCLDVLRSLKSSVVAESIAKKTDIGSNFEREASDLINDLKNTLSEDGNVLVDNMQNQLKQKISDFDIEENFSNEIKEQLNEGSVDAISNHISPNEGNSFKNKVIKKIDNFLNKTENLDCLEINNAVKKEANNEKLGELVKREIDKNITQFKKKLEKILTNNLEKEKIFTKNELDKLGIQINKTTKKDINKKIKQIIQKDLDKRLILNFTKVLQSAKALSKGVAKLDVAVYMYTIASITKRMLENENIIEFVEQLIKILQQNRSNQIKNIEKDNNEIQTSVKTIESVIKKNASQMLETMKVALYQ